MIAINAIYNYSGDITINNSNIHSTDYDALSIDGGNIVVTGGTITADNYRGVSIESGAAAKLDDVKIIINNSHVYGIFVDGSQVTLNDCNITANGNITECTGIAAYDSDITITGSDITGNEDAYSYGIYNSNSTVTLTDSHIKGGSRGIYCTSDGTLEISGNSSVETETGYGIYLYDGTFNLSGSPTISGAKADIYLYNGVITIDGKLAGEYTIDMSTPGVFTSGAKDKATADNFKSVNSDYAVVENSDGELELVKRHYHSIDGKDVEFTAWTKTDSLPTEPGNYYLTDNVNMSGGWVLGQDAEINLCLNGKQVYVLGGVQIFNFSTILSIYDDDEKNGTFAGGITLLAGTLNVYGGIFTTDSSAISVSGSESTLNLYGGTFSGGTCISCQSGTTTISGGTYKGDILVNGNFSLAGDIDLEGKMDINGDPIHITKKLENEKIYKIVRYNDGPFAVMDDENYASKDNFTPAVDGYTIVKIGSKLYMLEEPLHTHEGDKIFVPWSDTTSLPTESGNYYLTRNVTLYDEWNAPAGETVICLNGQTINTSAGGLKVGSSAKLVVCDEEKGTGQINNSYNAAIYCQSGGTVEINSGKISGGYGIRNEGGTVIVNGGIIEGTNYGIFSSGSVTVKGGKITGGSTGIFSNDVLEISGDTAEISGNTRGVWFNQGKFSLSGSPTISGTIGIQFEIGCININGELENNAPYIIAMSYPGVFAKGDFAKQYKDKFTPSSELTNDGYAITVTEDGELALTKHEHNGIKFMPWESKDRLPDTAGSWYLTEDVELTDYNGWKVPTGEVNLCLNGHDVNGQIVLNTTSTLNIYDCQETSGNITSSAQWGTLFINSSDSTVNIYGGNIKNTGTGDNFDYETAVYNGSGTLNIYGGNISGTNYAVVNTGDAKEFTVTGGTMTGGIYGIWTDKDIKISGDPEISGDQAGIFLYSGVITIADKLTGKYTIGTGNSDVFTSGAQDRATAENFAPSAELQEQGYEVTETADGELALTLKEYTITYNHGKDGTGTIEPTTKTHGDTVPLSSDKFTRLGYTQTGWAETENGKKTYDFGVDYEGNESIILYPAWEKNVITLSPSESNLKVDDKTSIKATVSPDTAVYAPIEWKVIGENGVIEFTVSDDSMSVDITTLKAGEVTLTASTDGGATTAECKINVTRTDSTVTPSTDETVTYGDKLTLTAEINKISPISLTALKDHVEFFNGETSLGSAKVTDGKAELTVKVTKDKFSIGENKIKAVYGGSISLNGSESSEITVTVEKRKLTPSISGDKFEKVYDGNDSADGLGLSIALANVVEGDNVTASADLTFNSANVNEAKTITADKITLSGTDAEYYVLSETSLTREGTISPASVDIPAKEYTYDGKISREIEIKGVNDETVTATLTAYSKNAGTYTYNINRAGGFYTAGLSSTNYAIKTAGTLTINTRLAKIEWQKETSFIYDETEKTVTATWTNKVENDDAELEFSENKKTKVGNYIATVEIIGTDSANYILESADKEQPWEITTADSGLTLSAKSETVTYGGNVSLTATIKRSETNGIMMMSAVQDKVEFYIGDDLIGTKAVSYTDGSNGTAILELPATSANHFKAGENTIRAEYGGSGNLKGSSADITITVNKKPVTAKIIGTNSKVYDGTNIITGLSLKLDGIENCDVGNVEAAAESYTFNSANVETANTITANGAELSGTQAENYTLTTVETISGTITPSPLEIQSYGFPYDGDNVFEIQLNGVNSETVNATLTAASKNAGTYTAENGYTIELDSSNYAVDLAGTLTINRLTATIKWSATEFYYDGEEKEVTATVTNAVAGDEFDISYSENTATNVGEYTAEIKSLGNDNYKLGDNISVEWSIKESKLLIDALPTSSAITYGQNLSESEITGGIVKNGDITVSGNFEWEDGSVKPAVSDSEKTKYTVKFIPEDKNYSEITTEITVKVNKRELAPSVSTVNDKTYDGKTTANSVIELSGAVNDEEPTATGIFNFTDKNAGENKSVNVSGIKLDDNWNDNYYLSVTSLENVETAAKISPLTAEIKWQENTSFIYDETEKIVTAIVTNAVDGDGFNISYDGNKETNVGEYTAKIMSLGNENYTLDGAENVTLSWKISAVGREETNVTINYIAETLSTSSDMEYSIDGETWISCTENMSVKSVGWNERESLTVKFRYAADKNHTAGEVQNVTIPPRPAAPDISGIKVTKTQDSITVTEIANCEYSIDGTTWQNSGTFDELTEGTEYVVQIRTKATENAFASFTAEKEIVTSDTSSGTTDLKTGETVETDNGSITNDGNKVEIEDNDGNKTTVIFPDGTSDSVEVDENGNVKVPDGSKVETGETTVELPNGGTVKPDGTIIADKVVTNDTTISGDNVTVMPNGNITVSENGTVLTGDTTVELPNGGTVKPDGTITADKVVTNDTTVSGDNVTVTPDGNITVSGNGTVQNGDKTVELPDGGKVLPDGTITADKVVTNDTTVSGDNVTVTPDGNITVSENGTVQTGDTTVELPNGGTVKPDGTITADKVVTGDTTISGDNVTVTPDGNITVSGNGTVQNGDKTVELPDGGKVLPDGTITADKVVTNDTTVSGDNVTVTPDGNITVSENGTVQNGDTTVELPNGGKISPNGTITADKVVTNDTTVSGDNVTVTPDGNITVSGNGTVQSGDKTVKLPNGGTVKPDGTITADKVVTDDTTISGDEVTVMPNGNITVSGNGKVQDGDTIVTGEKVTVDKDGNIAIPEGGSVYSADGSETVIGKDGSIKNDEVSIEPINIADYYDANGETRSLNNGYIVLDIENADNDKIVKDLESGSDISVIAAYDIRLLYNGRFEVQPKGTVKVTIAAPAGADGTEKVLHQNGNGFEDMNAEYDSNSNTFSFETDHFSIYIIAGTETSDEPITPPSIPQTVPDRPSPAPAVTEKTDNSDDEEDVSSGAEIVSDGEQIFANDGPQNIFVYLFAVGIAAIAIIAKKKRQK